MLLATEGVDLHFTDAAIREVARLAEEINRTADNIGARRLMSVLERCVEHISFSAPELVAKVRTGWGGVGLRAQGLCRRRAPASLNAAGAVRASTHARRPRRRGGRATSWWTRRTCWTARRCTCKSPTSAAGSSRAAAGCCPAASLALLLAWLDRLGAPLPHAEISGLWLLKFESGRGAPRS